MINQKLIQEIENSKLKAAYINSVNKGFKNRHNLKYIRNSRLQHQLQLLNKMETNNRPN